MAFITLVILLLSAYVPYIHSTHNNEYAIGPVSECSGQPEDLGAVIKTCYRRCMIDPEPVGRKTIQIHQSIDGSSGPMVVECSKIVQTQAFTQTWTFSTIKTDVKHHFAPVTEDECRRAIGENCPEYDCNHRESDELDPEYHYGSTTTVKKETISLIAMPSSVQLLDDSAVISPLSTDNSFRMDAQVGTDKLKLYLWMRPKKVSQCPFKESSKYGCDEYKGSDGSKYFMCSQGRFSVTPPPEDKDVASSICPGLKLSAEGFAYKEVEANAESALASTSLYANPSICPGLKLSAEGFAYKEVEANADSAEHGRVYITRTQSMAGDAEYLRHKITQALTHLDSEICTNQCEILSLETRTSSKTESLIRVGMTFYKVFHNGTATRCGPITGCKLTKPLVMCGNPPRLGVTCSTKSGLWDPLMPYMTPQGVCMKPDSGEKLTFKLGTREYIVDYDLIVHADRNFSHGVYPTAFSDLHQSGIQLSVSDLKTLKGDWMGAKSATGGLSSAKNVSSYIDSPTLSIGSIVMTGFNSVLSFFGSLEHIIGAIVIFCAVFASVCLTVKLVRWTRSAEYVRAPTVEMTQTSERTPMKRAASVVWM
ncbi:TPA_asm: G [Rose alphacytorhabdovirus 1]|nr:TPA_asm: G [Rose alphacytorhabdovirus 1]